MAGEGFPYNVLSWLVRARYRVTPPAAADGDTVEMRCDQAGRLEVVVASMPGSEPPVTKAVYRQMDGDRSGGIKVTAGVLHDLIAWNHSNVDLWIMLFNAAPVNGAVPVEQIYVRADGYAVFAPTTPVAFSNAIYWVASSTRGTLTLTLLENGPITMRAEYV